MNETTAAHAKMTIGAGLAGLSAVTLNEWVGLATLIYFLLQIGLLLPKYWAWVGKKRRK